ncbi:LLM class flavin-dependent oxidoreductase [Streptosporangium roseum]|uniref:LLM class flavin-dependent oxidoreductase n=1 Tax=Streptosporangium roseum TaxID=2001 RepID=UPI0009DF4A9F
MATLGYFLFSEEHGPKELVRQARLAERAGFEALWISDHFHPWLDVQGNSPFVWSVIGALAEATSLPITTAVTCPLVRVHPAIIAQAAATSAALTGGRFRLGVGTGEALNEHIIDAVRARPRGPRPGDQGVPRRGLHRGVRQPDRRGAGRLLRLLRQGGPAAGALSAHRRRRRAPARPTRPERRRP